jgi:Uma2 family endonuclease
MTEVEIQFETHEVYVPDVAGWRRDRAPDRPKGKPVLIRPDWVCEILSPSTARRDQVAKQKTFHRCGVPHFWIVDPDREVLTVQRWEKDGYLVVLPASRGEKVRAEPFDAIEIAVGQILGDDPEEQV